MSKQVAAVAAAVSSESNGAAAASRGGSAKAAAAATTTVEPPLNLVHWVWMGVAAYLVFVFANAAYSIRMGAINEYGPVIHEFDPYFNYRATEYLYWNGWDRFSKWFDHMSWYPLGRPVGTTIYPGMQVTAVWIKNHLLPWLSSDEWSINDVCCYIPVWFGVLASFITGLIAYEASIPVNSSASFIAFVGDLIQGKISEPLVVVQLQNHNQPLPSSFLGGLSSPAVECFLATMGLMAIVPAHLMRSIGGGYDNESIAMTAMVLTFYFWMRSLRTGDKYAFLWGFPTALAYFYMVATWGGYVFVLNMIGVHAVALVLMGRFQFKVWAAYSIFYSLGTLLAMQVPVVGRTPLKSLEQLGPCLVFLAYQLLMITETIRKQRTMNRLEGWRLRVNVFSAALFFLVIGIFCLAPSGYFGPLSSRVRGLFVKHSKTGNPLVDSVAEHQAASPKAYFQYLHHVCSLAPIGYVLLFFKLSESTSFLLVWGAAAYFFSHKMVRLILLTAPIGCVLAGVLAGRVLAWAISQWFDQTKYQHTSGPHGMTTTTSAAGNGEAVSAGGKRKKKKSTAQGQPSGGNAHSSASSSLSHNSSFGGLLQFQEAIEAALLTKEGISAKRLVSSFVFFATYALTSRFIPYCFGLSKQLSHPTVIQKARTREGDVVVIDDYRDAYFWLRDNTPTDARIMAWWDYGYQIAGIANRTSIADGNTWNHEHIALLGMALTSELSVGYEISRHWADYILVWAGGGGDDLAKSPHLARIANSVYRDHCPDDPTCRAFHVVDRQGTPSPMMRRSLLYTLHSSGLRPDVNAPADKFVEVYRSKYGKVRIWKILGISMESKAWVANPANRKCDAPGSWFCPGQYPPGLSSMLARKKDFAQLEDFNRGSFGGGGGDDEYTRQYFENLRDPETARRKVMEQAQQKQQQQQPTANDNEDNENEENSDTSTTQQEQDESAPQEEEEEVASLEEIQRRKETLYENFENTEHSTMMWEFIHSGNIQAIQSWLEVEPWWAFLRSEDGRGPMWWAFEERNNEIVQYLMSIGVPHNDRDKKGLTPADLQTRV